jgi:thioredoxin-dependent peroxiredoxin
VSGDSVKKHAAFKRKYNLPFMLLADTEHAICKAYGVWKEKSMFGRKYMGIERSTFIVDADGKIAHVFPKVKIAGHADEVAAAVEKA